MPLEDITKDVPKNAAKDAFSTHAIARADQQFKPRKERPLLIPKPVQCH